MVHSCVGTTSTSGDRPHRPLVRTRACGTALTAVYVHHIGTRISIPHTYTDTTYGRVAHLNWDRGEKMPSGSTVRSLYNISSALHTRAADGEHTCRLPPVPACTVGVQGCISVCTCVFVCACLRVSTHTRTHTYECKYKSIRIRNIHT